MKRSDVFWLLICMLLGGMVGWLNGCTQHTAHDSIYTDAQQNQDGVYWEVRE